MSKKTKKGAQKYVPKIMRGMRDILPEEMPYWDFVLRRACDLAETFGFKRIETPILEEKQLFVKSTGQTTDVVEKQMYEFTDLGGNRVVMRPEITPQIVRAYIEQGMFNLPQPIKLFYFGPLFRYERPQSGRLREFHQFGLEVLGSIHPIVDAQIVLFSYTLFKNIGLNVITQINSLGCPICRRTYRTKLVSYFRSKRKHLCPDCKRRLEKNPLRILDCKETSCHELATQSPQIVDNLCDECKNHFVKVLEYLDEANIPYELNPYLVRGLDYYTKTVFEFWPSAASAPQNEVKIDVQPTGEGITKAAAEIKPTEQEKTLAIALGGGGRYDNLVESLGGRSAPAIGFAYGLERIIDELKAQKVKILQKRAPQIFLAKLGEAATRRALKLFDDLQKEGFRVAENLSKDSLRTQLEIANRLGVK